MTEHEKGKWSEREASEMLTTQTRSHAEEDHIAAGGATSPGKGRRRQQPDPPIETYLHPTQTHSLNLPNPFPVSGPSTGFSTLMSAHNSPGLSFASLPVSASASPSMFNFPLPLPFADGPPYSPSIPDSTQASASGSPLLHHAIPLSRASSHSATRRASSRLVPDTQTEEIRDLVVALPIASERAVRNDVNVPIADYVITCVGLLVSLSCGVSKESMSKDL